MIRRALALWLLVALALPLAAANRPPADPNPSVTVVMQTGWTPVSDGRGGTYDEPTWRPIDASRPNDVAAEQMVRRVMARSYPIKRVAQHALEVLDDYHQLPGGAGVFPLNSDGRLIVMLDDIGANGANGGAYVNHRGDPAVRGARQAYVALPITSLEHIPIDQQAKRDFHVEDLLTHELDHIDLMFTEVDITGRYGVDYRTETLFGGSKGGAHTVFSVNEPGFALIEGMAEARQLFHFRTRTFISNYFRDDLFSNHAWATIRNRYPFPLKVLVRLAELTRLQPGAINYRCGRWPSEAYLESNFDDPAMQSTGSRFRMRTVQEMFSCEGMVCLMLNDLYEAGLASPEQVSGLIHEARGRIRGMPELLEHLKAAAPDAATRGRIDAIRSRRMLGADLDFTRASDLLMKRLNGQLTAGEYGSQIDDIIKQGTGTTLPDSTVIADVPGQRPEGSPVQSSPFERFRAIVEAAGEPAALQEHMKFMVSFFVSHYAISLVSNFLARAQGSQAQGSINPVDDMGQSLSSMLDPQFILSSAIYSGTDKGINLALAISKDMASKSSMASRISRILSVNSRFGGVLGMMVGSFLCRQILGHDYSFWNCSTLSFGDKVVDTLGALINLSNWDRTAWLELGLGTAGFAVVFAVAAAIDIPTAGLGGIAVGAVAFFVSWLGSLLADVIGGWLDRLDYDNCRQAVRWVIDEYKKTDPSVQFGGRFIVGQLDAEDVTALRAATTLAAKRAALAHALGTVGLKDDGQFHCDPKQPPAKRPAVLKGLLKKFFDLRDKWLGKVLSDLASFMGDRQKEQQQHRKELDSTTCPLTYYRDTEMHLKEIAYFFAWDNHGNRLTADEIADYVTYVWVNSPDLNNRNIAATDKAGIEKRWQEFQVGIAAWFNQLSEPDLRVQHDRTAEEWGGRHWGAQVQYERFHQGWVTQIKDKLTTFVGELNGQFKDEGDDLNGLGLDAAAPDAAELLKFVEERKDGYRKLSGTYEELLRGQQQMPAN